MQEEFQKANRTMHSWPEETAQPSIAKISKIKDR